MSRKAVLVAIAALATACRAPAEAPGQLEALAAYLFAHGRDEDPDALVAGAENLSAWLDGHLEETLEGYTIDNLAKSDIAGLDERERSLDGLVGAAVASDSRHGVRAFIDPLVWGDPMEQEPGAYESFDKQFGEGRRCFPDCDYLRAEIAAVANYPLGLVVDSSYTAEYRWLELEAGPALMHRTYLKGPAEVSLDWLAVDAQFFLSIVLPVKGGARRLQATWISASMGDKSVPEDMALQLVIDSMRDQQQRMDDWVSENR
jgi:hypothetical protein